jgi:hypothetical protein
MPNDFRSKWFSQAQACELEARPAPSIASILNSTQRLLILMNIISHNCEENWCSPSFRAALMHLPGVKLRGFADQVHFS